MRSRVFSVVAAGALAVAVATSFAPAAGARTLPGIKAHHVGHAVVSHVHSNVAVLYDQNNHPTGDDVTSQNFEAADDAFDNQGADTFKVPAGTTWTIKEVDVTGVYYNCTTCGPAASENVTFYKNAAGAPGAVVVAKTKVGADSAGSFAISGLKVKLKKGTYWVSVQANLDFGTGGQWGWGTRTKQTGTAAMWQNPGDGFGTGCVTYSDLDTCLGLTGEPDLMFTLRGTHT